LRLIHSFHEVKYREKKNGLGYIRPIFYSKREQLQSKSGVLPPLLQGIGLVGDKLRKGQSEDNPLWLIKKAKQPPISEAALP
jgi:hypothetical protein